MNTLYTLTRLPGVTTTLPDEDEGEDDDAEEDDDGKLDFPLLLLFFHLSYSAV